MVKISEKMNQTMKIWQMVIIQVAFIFISFLFTRFGQHTDNVSLKIDSKADISALEKVDKESKDRDVYLETKVYLGDKATLEAIKDLRIEMNEATKEQTRLIIETIKKK
jgi:hypothetical protein